MNEPNTLGRRIQEGRRSAGLSQEALGEQLDVSRQAVSKWEADTAIPELENLIAMSRIFGVSIGQLLGVEEPAQSGPPAETELTETQIQLAETIATKYMEASQPDRRTRNRNLAVGIFAGLLTLVLISALWNQLLDMDRRFDDLRRDVDAVNRSMVGQIDALGKQIRDIIAEETSILSDFQVSVTDFDMKAETVTLSVSAVAKSWTEATTAGFTAALSGGETLTTGAANNRGIFTAEGWVVPMDKAIVLSLVLTDDGISRAEMASTLYDVVPESFRLRVSGGFSSTSTYPGSGRVDLEGLDLEIDVEAYSEQIEPLAAMAPQAVEICLYRNQETKPEQVLPVAEAVPQFRSMGSVDLDRANYTLTYDLAPKDTVVTVLRVTDSFGTTTWTVLDIHLADKNGTVWDRHADNGYIWKPGYTVKS